jgi:hypothetical protein
VRCVWFDLLDVVNEAIELVLHLDFCCSRVEQRFVNCDMLRLEYLLFELHYVILFAILLKITI